VNTIAENGLTTRKLDSFFRSVLDLETFSGADPSLNGIQVDNDGSAIGKIAFAVDACAETFERAVEAGAGMVFVHHGLFWGQPLRVERSHRQRIKILLDNNVALYAVHLPLDQHPEYGNNAALAKLLGIQEPESFGLWRGHKIGYKGRLSKPLTVEEAVSRISFMGRKPLGVYPFGKKESLTCAVISGGASDEAFQAIEEDIDLYVTGESNHTIYHPCMEEKINYIAGGHYLTEVWGVRNMMELCVNQLHIDACFIDVPTGL
jgi:dinuclear metal center YbgI/SA1388 family protein